MKSLILLMLFCLTCLSMGSNAPEWFANCEGVECLLQVMHFTPFRLGVNTIDTKDHVKGRFQLNSELKEELFEAEMEALEEIHRAEMETAKLELELLKMQALKEDKNNNLEENKIII